MSRAPALSPLELPTDRGWIQPWFGTGDEDIPCVKVSEHTLSFTLLPAASLSMMRQSVWHVQSCSEQRGSPGGGHHPNVCQLFLCVQAVKKDIVHCLVRAGQLHPLATTLVAGVGCSHSLSTWLFTSTGLLSTRRSIKAESKQCPSTQNDNATDV